MIAASLSVDDANPIANANSEEATSTNLLADFANEDDNNVSNAELNSNNCKNFQYDNPLILLISLSLSGLVYDDFLKCFFFNNLFNIVNNWLFNWWWCWYDDDDNDDDDNDDDDDDDDMIMLLMIMIW